MKTEAVKILKVYIHALSLVESLQLLEQRIQDKQGGYICLCPVSSLVRAEEDRQFCDIINNAFLATADGMPVLWCLKTMGCKQAMRIHGYGLMQAIFQVSREKGYRHYFYGGEDAQLLERLKIKILRQFPCLDICGMYAPPFNQVTAPENEKFIDAIRQLQPDIIWVGLGSPKQEKWMAFNAPQLQNSILIGVGAAFNYYAEVLSLPPLWLQRLGMEWLWRLWLEPKRLWKRYLYGNSKFVYLIAKALVWSILHKIIKVPRQIINVKNRK